MALRRGTFRIQRTRSRCALITGYRVSELSSLFIGDFDSENCTLHLHADNAKDRKERITPISIELTNEIKRFIGKKKQKDKLIPKLSPKHSLCPEYSARYFDKDLKTAGINKKNFEGKLDFHALRVAHVNLVKKSGFDFKTAQDMARHSSAEMTIDVYAKSSMERQRNAVEIISEKINDAYETVNTKSIPMTVQHDQHTNKQET